ncbi:GMC oxidoreductase [Flagellimonas algicola]|uniref:GMC family oxidoreductase n=1 Tax=Flagellimonas algicola TaxID=2583815 RepID=A0ABY2WGM8_9FLAO|nr:GMC family oxidoreductase [Allomuricauda algicola]TMU50706.1 GMC family oxidoreductase [Allomuricauda algicola]
MEKERYDIIVVGSGVTGGWAAKEFTESGLRTLVLERGREVRHIKDYSTTNKSPWEYRYKGYDPHKIKEQYHVQSLKYNFNASSQQYFVNDSEHPYTYPNDKPFRWFRGYQTGGRSIIWGRGCFRLGDLEFEANLNDGHGIDWPIRYKDIEPWYDHVEKFIGICGTKENIAHYPDGKTVLPAFDMNTAEKVIKQRLESYYSDRKLIPVRMAHLTKVEPGQFKGRSACQSRNMCHAGCPFGAYFSSNSSTLPAAEKTGNLTLRSNSIVESIIYDSKLNRAIGVRIIDAGTFEKSEYFARVIFLCASTLASTGILLNSKSEYFPNGLGNSSGVLGHYLMDHHKNIAGTGTLRGHLDKIDHGHRPSGVTIPRFRNLGKQETDFLRGYGIYGRAFREGINPKQVGVGVEFKDRLTRPGPWRVALAAYGECLPYFDNKVVLDKKRRDKWGLPLLKISAGFRENELKMRRDMRKQIEEIMRIMGLKDIKITTGSHIAGDATHEMGTARMGNDPKFSVVNKFNQSHDIPNLFITDGSCMASSSYLSPSFTYMALTARACDHAIGLMQKGSI